MVEHSPQILPSEEKATTTTRPQRYRPTTSCMMSGITKTDNDVEVSIMSFVVVFRLFKTRSGDFDNRACGTKQPYDTL